VQTLFRSRLLTEKALLLLLYFLLAAVLMPYHRYFIHLSDSFQYLRIAEEYARGNFSEAVNSYWSPLFSWLLAVLLKAGVEPFLAIQLLQVATGALALSGMLVLIPFGCSNRVPYLLFFFSYAILIVSFALLVASPDLLLLAIGIWYLVLLSKENYYVTNKYSFLVIGTLGAALYVAKGAGFIFFLLSFSLSNIVYYVKCCRSKKKVVVKYISTVVTFLTFSFLWIIPISLKEDKILFSSAPEYNFKLIGPASNPNTLGELHHPYEWLGLVSPARENAINAWEEPQKLTLSDWSPLDSRTNLFHYIKVVLRNLWSIQSYYFGIDAGTVLLLGMLILLLYRKSEIKSILLRNKLPIIISVSCTLPYVFVLVMDRHIWLNTVVIGILAISFFNSLVAINKNLSVVFLLLFSLLTAYKPAKELLTVHSDYTSIFSAKQKLSEYVSGNTASVLTDNEIGGENYTKSTIVSYLAGSKYFGMICVPGQLKTMHSDLKQDQIKYLLSWNNSFVVPDSLYLDAVEFPETGVKIYELK